MGNISWINGQTNILYWLVIFIAIIYVVFRLLRSRYGYGGIIGVLGNILGYFPTVVHEFGHVVGCKLFFGRVDDIVLVHTRKNQKTHGAYGYAVTYNKGRIARTVKTFLGYMFPPLVLLSIIYLNGVNKLTVVFIVLGLASVYLLVKTSNKLPVLLNLGMLSIMVYLLVSGGYLEGNISIILSIVVSVLLGLLLGETVFSMYNMVLLWLTKSDSWDGYLIKEYIYLPIIVSIFLWYIFTGYVLYLTYMIM